MTETSAPATEQADGAAQWAEIERAVARLRASVMAVVMGLTAGTGLFVATIWLVVRGGPVVGPTLGLLGQYFPGYSVTFGGAFLGFFYAGVLGAAIGWSVAFVYNRVVERGS
jgi:hypothetical protein